MSGCRTRVPFRTAMFPALLTQSVTAYRGSGSVVASDVTALKVTVLSEPPPSTPWFLYSRWLNFPKAWRWNKVRVLAYSRTADSLLFANRDQTHLGCRNVLRDVKLRYNHLGFTPPTRTLQAFRHTFAVNYLRRGGSVFHLQKCLGHSTVEMTRRYANLMTEDLQAVHERISLLSSR